MPPLPIDWNSFLTTFEKIGAAYVISLPTGWLLEKEGHAVGIRTFPIVAMATCAYLMIIRPVAGADHLAASSRVLQGLVAGIGFVGGGAIVKDGLNVRGTATAASIWNTGAIGAAVALENYEVAIVLGLLNLFTLKALVPVKNYLANQKKPDMK
ncbi:MAG: MgtC/SapB family protein [Terriglobia bacterium]